MTFDAQESRIYFSAQEGVWQACKLEVCSSRSTERVFEFCPRVALSDVLYPEVSGITAMLDLGRWRPPASWDGGVNEGSCSTLLAVLCCKRDCGARLRPAPIMSSTAIGFHVHRFAGHCSRNAPAGHCSQENSAGSRWRSVQPCCRVDW